MMHNHKMVPLKHACALNPEVLPESTPEDTEISYVDISSVNLIDGILSTEEMVFGNSPSRARKPVKAGDIVISTVRTYLKAIALVDDDHDGCIVSTGFAVLRCGKDVEARYLIRALQSDAFVGSVIAASTGVSYPAITPTALGAIKVPLPPLPVQMEKAAEIDRQLERIDALLFKKRAAIALLTEKLITSINLMVSGQTVEAVPKEGPSTAAFTQLPSHWKTQRLGSLFRESGETGATDLPVLSVTIAQGVSDRELTDDDRDRVVNHMEDKAAYKVVASGDLVYNMMRAWQGALGMVRVPGVVSPAYVVARPMANLHSNYFEALLRSPVMIEEMRRVSKGIADFRRRLYWADFKRIIVPVPPLSEQVAISNAINHETQRVDVLRNALERSIDLLLERRRAVINNVIDEPIALARPITASVRTLVSAEIIFRHRSVLRFGRVKLQKILYLAETHLGIAEIDGHYHREAAGPLDRLMLDDVESELVENDLYVKDRTDRGGIVYVPASRAGTHADDMRHVIPRKVDDLRALIDLVRDLDTSATEMVTTLYAVWNDDLIDGRQTSDDAVVAGVLDEWHPEKRIKFTADDLHHWLAWMKRNGLTPRGNGPRTIETMPKDLFAGSGNQDQKGERR